MKRTKIIILCLILVISALLLCVFRNKSSNERTYTQEPASQSETIEHLRLERDDWADDVKTALNDLLMMYGSDSETPADHLTVLGSPVSKAIGKKSVMIQY